MITSETPALTSGYATAIDAVQGFRHHGHTLLRSVATPSEARAYRDLIRSAALRESTETRPLEERDTYGKAFLQVTNLWQHDEAVARFVTAERFARVAAALLGVPRVRLYHDQALFKEPGGGHTPWHQDAMYWPLDGARCLTMWMPMVDITPDMGGMRFASGTHLEGALSDIHISDASEGHFDRLLSASEYQVADPVPMRAGDATFHAGWTVHKALANQSSVTREVMTVIWFADGLAVQEPANEAQAHDLSSWLPGLSPGDPAASALNPVCSGAEGVPTAGKPFAP